MNIKSIVVYLISFLLSTASIFVVGFSTYQEKLKIFLDGFTTKSEGLNVLFTPLLQLEAFVFISIPFIVFVLCLLVKVLFVDELGQT